LYQIGMKNEALKSALDAFGGNQSSLARALGVSPQLVSYWSRNGLPSWREPILRGLAAEAAQLEDLTPPYPRAAATDLA